jgi:hypothetical protein
MDTGFDSLQDGFGERVFGRAAQQALFQPL